MPTNDGIYIGLTKVAGLFYQKMLDRLNAGNYPHGDQTRNPPTTSIQDATSVGQVKQEGANAYIDVTISLKQAPYAGAYEWGSGLHSEKGNKSKYVISPKEKDALAFDWPDHDPPWGSRKFIGVLSDGRFLFRFVEHPGVASKPYIRPTLQENRAEFKKILAREFKASILRGTQKVTIIHA